MIDSIEFGDRSDRLRRFNRLNSWSIFRNSTEHLISFITCKIDLFQTRNEYYWMFL